MWLILIWIFTLIPKIFTFLARKCNRQDITRILDWQGNSLARSKNQLTPYQLSHYISHCKCHLLSYYKQYSNESLNKCLSISKKCLFAINFWFFFAALQSGILWSQRLIFLFLFIMWSYHRFYEQKLWKYTRW